MSARRPDFASYQCGDYLESPLGRTGYYSKEAYLWVVVPKEQAEELKDLLTGLPLGFLKIGSSGVDGESFGYKRGEVGIWAHDPILNEFHKIANDLSEFLDLYRSGNLVW